MFVREIDREGERHTHRESLYVRECVCVCVRETDG